METQFLIEHLSQVVGADNNGPPLYRRLKDGIQALVASGALGAGDVLPSERTLAQSLSLSRVTVRKSLAALVEEGLALRRHGARTEITSYVEKSLSTLTSFSEDIASRGLTPGCVWLSRELGRPSPAEMMGLGIPAHQTVIRLKRVRTANANPIAVETSTVPTRFLPSPVLVTESLYAALDRLGVLPNRAVQRMRARPASVDDSRHLNCATGAPLLSVERRCFLADASIVEFSETRYRGDVYDFVVELRR